jgi:sugar/nucleoside kinase (ribokinase family)
VHVNKDLDVVVVCEVNVDIVVAGVDAPPRFGAERRVSDVVLTAGSSGVLTATGLADLGLRVGVCGLVGDDTFGRYMLDHLAGRHIDHSGIVVDASARTGASVLLSGRDDRAILTHPGAMVQFGLSHIKTEVLARARHLHLSSYFLQEGLQPDVPALLKHAHTLGLTTSVDTGHDPAEKWIIDGLLDHTDAFLPNHVEALAISGSTDVGEALSRLAARVPVVAIKCGADGAWAARSGERVLVPGFAIQARDTTGAGDAFDAGFLSGWLAGAGLTASVRRGNACGALTAAHVGGTGALSVDRVDALLARAGTQG